ncbi:hypothetical protein GCK32_011306 [Trichostrongylus colubriformis]|uniref:Uncharacterized protein n=1 Tax=Trichostrongylus colubriformis TaxID=6319 RepID=A0AAN8EU53_TRICO
MSTGKAGHIKLDDGNVLSKHYPPKVLCDIPRKSERVRNHSLSPYSSLSDRLATSLELITHCKGRGICSTTTTLTPTTLPDTTSLPHTTTSALKSFPIVWERIEVPLLLCLQELRLYGDTGKET